LKENLYKFYNSSKHLSRKEIFDRFIAIQDECLDPYLLPSIKKYHWIDQYVFWPDQASAYYAK